MFPTIVDGFSSPPVAPSRNLGAILDTLFNSALIPDHLTCSKSLKPIHSSPWPLSLPHPVPHPLSPEPLYQPVTWSPTFTPPIHSPQCSMRDLEKLISKGKSDHALSCPLPFSDSRVHVHSMPTWPIKSRCSRSSLPLQPHLQPCSSYSCCRAKHPKLSSIKLPPFSYAHRFYGPGICTGHHGNSLSLLHDVQGFSWKPRRLGTGAILRLVHSHGRHIMRDDLKTRAAD